MPRNRFDLTRSWIGPQRMGASLSLKVATMPAQMRQERCYASLNNDRLSKRVGWYCTETVSPTVLKN
ncbi:MAG: hypothetical protein A3G81_03835 [Betaproteobacteria bacterium RIFCSPLOWO2_12_FULL_65_14]|nr:MAG: hypothetical protein A3G81_03835 [Betaproteobacteria bacterium RIFCSPLOWO2_12_FULL_65_14]